MKNILITGANRGIGYGLVKQFAAMKVDHIFATYRRMDRSKVTISMRKSFVNPCFCLQRNYLNLLNKIQQPLYLFNLVRKFDNDSK